MDALSRRQFIATGGGALVGVGLGSVYLASRSTAQTGFLLRPPGALTEDDFLAACIRCGQCVEACPSDVLRLADLDAGTSAGTPYFVPAETPCDLCQGQTSLKCVDTCPTAALSRVEIRDVDIGEAHICKGKCLAYNGTVCRACWHACPFPGEAIVFDELLRPTVHIDKCVGCGLCEFACPTEPKAVEIVPRENIVRQRTLLQQPKSRNQRRQRGGSS